MTPSGADLQVGEILWQVRVRLAVGCLHPDRRMPFRGRPVAELAIAVVSPGVGVAVAAHGQRMTPSGADLHVGESCRLACRLPHFDRRKLSGAGRSVAELANVVESPCVDVPVTAQGQRMPVSGADLHVGEILWQVRVRVAVGRLHPDRRSLPDDGRSVAELVIAVVPPCIGVAVAAHSKRIIESGADLHVGEILWQVRIRAAVGRLHPDRRSPVGPCPVAELAIAVESPCVGVAVAAHSKRIIESGADLHVGEILWQVRIRAAVGRLHPDRRSPVAGARPVAELAILVVSPGVGVPVAAHSQGMTVSSADLTEPDAPAGAVRRGDGGGFPAQLAALVRDDAPRVVPACGHPLGGQGQVLVDGLAEVVGDFAYEPSVEQEAFPRRVGGGAFHPAVRCGEMLVCWFGFPAARVEVDRGRGSWFGASGQGLVDRVFEVSGEGLAVLLAGDENGGWPRLACGYVRLP